MHPIAGLRAHRSLLIFVTGMVLIALTTGGGCLVSSGKNTIHPIIPPENDIRSMALIGFDGIYGSKVRGQLIKNLSKGKNFILINAACHTPFEINRDDRADEEKIVALFEKFRTDMLLTGRVSADIQDRYGTDPVQIQEGTGQYKKIKNEFGNWVEVEINRVVLKPMPCVIRKAFLSTDFTVYNLETRRMIAAGTVTETYNKKFAVDGQKDFAGDKADRLPTWSQTIDVLSAKLAVRMAAKIFNEMAPALSSETDKKYF